MIRVVLVDDETLVADSLATLIGLEEDIDVVHVAYSGTDFLQWWEALPAASRPDVVVTDLQLGAGQLDGIALASLIDARVVVVTSHARPNVVRRALDSEVLGMLPKTAAAGELAAAVRAAHAGKRYVDPELAAATIAAGQSPLTAREAEVLELVGKGGSIEAIASAAHLAPGTTRNYISSAITKTGAENRFEAYTIARERGWL
ncbi:response regulator transcription factor [Corynebacterium sp. HMSC074A01]|uniref:response regulator transcription factor n=1 Tax=Corynebacterium sp. HMSC074A01 TaxID=1715030 RepID=UPI0008A212FD|nr:response regulator transcription factor [Corynebacterium sp. HMSC074A01]OHF39875.1 DNA-binding response regulator [Corynebacterium sp. HMSC074A01]